MADRDADNAAERVHPEPLAGEGTLEHDALELGGQPHPHERPHRLAERPASAVPHEAGHEARHGDEQARRSGRGMTKRTGNKESEPKQNPHRGADGPDAAWCHS